MTMVELPNDVSNHAVVDQKTRGVVNLTRQLNNDTVCVPMQPLAFVVGRKTAGVKLVRSVKRTLFADGDLHGHTPRSSEGAFIARLSFFNVDGNLIALVPSQLSTPVALHLLMRLMVFTLPTWQ